MASQANGKPPLLRIKSRQDLFQSEKSKSPPVPALAKASEINSNGDGVLDREDGNDAEERIQNSVSSLPVSTIQKQSSHMSQSILETLCLTCRIKTQSIMSSTDTVSIMSSTDTVFIPHPPEVKQHHEQHIRKVKRKVSNTFPYPVKSPFMKRALTEDGKRPVVRHYVPVDHIVQVQNTDNNNDKSNDQLKIDLQNSESSSQDDVTQSSACTVIPNTSQSNLNTSSQTPKSFTDTSQNESIVQNEQNSVKLSDKGGSQAENQSNIEGDLPCVLAPSPVMFAPKVEVEVLRKSEYMAYSERKVEAQHVKQIKSKENVSPYAASSQVKPEEQNSVISGGNPAVSSITDIESKTYMTKKTLPDGVNNNNLTQPNNEQSEKKSGFQPHPPSPSSHVPTHRHHRLSHFQRYCQNLSDSIRASTVHKPEEQCLTGSQQSLSSVTSVGSNRSHTLAKAVKFHLIASLASLQDGDEDGICVPRTPSPPIRSITSLPDIITMTKSTSAPSFLSEPSVPAGPPSPPLRSYTLPTFGNQVVTDLNTLRQLYPRKPRRKEALQDQKAYGLQYYRSELRAQRKRSALDRKASKRVLFRIGSESTSSVTNESRQADHEDGEGSKDSGSTHKEAKNGHGDLNQVNVEATPSQNITHSDIEVNDTDTQQQVNEKVESRLPFGRNNLHKKSDETEVMSKGVVKSETSGDCDKVDALFASGLGILAGEPDDNGKMVKASNGPGDMNGELTGSSKHEDLHDVVCGTDNEETQLSCASRNDQSQMNMLDLVTCDSTTEQSLNSAYPDDDILSAESSITLNISGCEELEEDDSNIEEMEKERTFVVKKRMPTPFHTVSNETEDKDLNPSLTDTFSIGKSTDTYTVNKSSDTYAVDKSSDTYIVLKSTDTYSVAKSTDTYTVHKSGHI